MKSIGPRLNLVDDSEQGDRMSFSFNEVFPVLASGVPGFEPSEDEWVEPLAYCFLNDMVRFVCDRTWANPTVEAERFGNLLEKLIIEGDNEVQYLVIDALEGLLEREEREIIAGQFGPLARRRWEILVGKNPWPEGVPYDWAKFPK
jgi:hypothetical protein